jgi:hypothetical protein
VSFVVTFLLFHAAMWRSSPEPKIPLMRPEQATRPFPPERQTSTRYDVSIT